MSSRQPTATRSRLVRLLPLVAAGALLAGCGIHPGDAARVGGFTLTRSDLDTVTAAQCDLAAGASVGKSAQQTSRATTAQTTIALVVQARQGIRYAETHDVDVDASQLRAARASFDDQLSGKGLTREQRDALLDVSDLISRGQLVAQTVGAKALGIPAAQASGAQQQALQRGSEIVGRWASRSGPKVTIDPRYNIGVEGGQLRLRDASVSQPVSAVGKQSASQDQSSSYVGALPLPQRCG